MTNVIIKCLKLCYHKQNKAHMDYFYHLLMILTMVKCGLMSITGLASPHSVAVVRSLKVSEV